MRSPIASELSSAAAPPGMILVTKIPSSPGICSVPLPPAILKPKPVTQPEVTLYLDMTLTML